MKPIDATAMPVSCDLSGMALNEAYNTLSSHLRNNGYYVLRCASQLVPMALLMLNGWGITLEIDFAYTPDEWSLHVSRWDHETEKFETSSVWSPGA